MIINIHFNICTFSQEDVAFFCNTLRKFTFSLRLFDKIAILSAFRWRNLHFFLKIYDETYAFINIRLRNSCFFGTPLMKQRFSEIFWRDLDFFAFFWDKKNASFHSWFFDKSRIFLHKPLMNLVVFSLNDEMIFLASISQIMRYFCMW